MHIKEVLRTRLDSKSNFSYMFECLSLYYCYGVDVENYLFILFNMRIEQRVYESAVLSSDKVRHYHVLSNDFSFTI
ncbi:hypothetical protein J2Y37_000579 [Prolinoborus sp. 3657]|nr:hypothetical protein [Prolinoborus sp. 3657]